MVGHLPSVPFKAILKRGNLVPFLLEAETETSFILFCLVSVLPKSGKMALVSLVQFFGEN